jgi:anti-anti-sigma factor
VILRYGSFSADMSNSDSGNATAQGGRKTVSLGGEQLNRFGAGRAISAHLEELAAGRTTHQVAQLHLDLKSVKGITSAGLNELIGINSQARNRGIRLVLLDVQESVREIFSLTRLERMFEFDCSNGTTEYSV